MELEMLESLKDAISEKYTLQGEETKCGSFHCCLCGRVLMGNSGWKAGVYDRELFFSMKTCLCSATDPRQTLIKSNLGRKRKLPKLHFVQRMIEELL